MYIIYRIEEEEEEKEKMTEKERNSFSD